MMTVRDFQPDWASPPGETIAEALKSKRITIGAFAKLLGKSKSFADDLISGETDLTDDIAEILEETIGGSRIFWLKREEFYRDSVTIIEKRSRAAQNKEWLREIPVRDMVKYGWLNEDLSSDDKAEACLEFFNVSSVGAWRSQYSGLLEAVAFRTSSTFDSHPGAVAAWLRKGELESEAINCKPWSAEAFRAALPAIRTLTRKKDPARFIPELSRLCADAGVAIAIVRAPAGCRASGATRFLTPGKALLMLSFRYRSDDHFWFTFFHEAGHLLLHGEQGLFLEGTDMITSHEEEEANQFAADILLPPHLRREVQNIGTHYRDIMRFARQAGVSPGIVVGQLQHAGILRRNQLNFLKTRYSWTEE